MHSLLSPGHCVKGAFDTAKQILPKQASDHFAINKPFHDTSTGLERLQALNLPEDREHTHQTSLCREVREVTVVRSNDLLVKRKLVAARVRAFCSPQANVCSQVAAPGSNRSHDQAGWHLAGQRFYLFRHRSALRSAYVACSELSVIRQACCHPLKQQASA